MGLFDFFKKKTTHPEMDKSVNPPSNSSKQLI